uniref:Latrophilin Cirl n=1 Tax=Steinernema glaseri TaxID=37863 RepID=A0A1I7YR16_9BILA
MRAVCRSRLEVGVRRAVDTGDVERAEKRGADRPPVDQADDSWHNNSRSIDWLCRIGYCAPWSPSPGDDDNDVVAVPRADKRYDYRKKGAREVFAQAPAGHKPGSIWHCCQRRTDDECVCKYGLRCVVRADVISNYTGHRPGPADTVASLRVLCTPAKPSRLLLHDCLIKGASSLLILCAEPISCQFLKLHSAFIPLARRRCVELGHFLRWNRGRLPVRVGLRTPGFSSFPARVFPIGHAFFLDNIRRPPRLDWSQLPARLRLASPAALFDVLYAELLYQLTMRRNSYRWRMSPLGFALAALLLICAKAESLDVEQEDSKLNSVLICEGDVANFTCPPGKHISVHIANYGRYSLGPCNPSMNTDFNTVCQNANTIPRLQERCNGQERCVFPVSNEFLGDPCPKTTKYLELQYTCSNSPVTTTTSTTTTTTTTTPEPTTVVRVESAERQVEVEIDEESRAPSTQAPVVYCPKTERRHIVWPKTELSHAAHIPCPDGTGFAHWNCSPSGEWTPQMGPDLSECSVDWSKRLIEDISREGHDPTVQRETLRDIISFSRRGFLYGGDLHNIARVMTEVMSLYKQTPGDERYNPQNMDDLLIEAVDSVLKTDERSAWLDLQTPLRGEVADALLSTVEDSVTNLVQKTAITSQHFVKPSVFVEVGTVNVYDYVQFPSVSLYKNTFDSVELPREALEHSGKNVAAVVYAAYENLGEFMSPEEESYSDEPKKEIVSRIVTTSLVKNGRVQGVRGLTKPVVLTMRTHRRNSNHSNPQCVWWERQRKIWRNDGCRLRSQNDTHSVCECDHLTHFAVLMDVHGLELSTVHDVSLTFLTYAGCTLSVVSCVLAFLAFTLLGGGDSDRLCIHKNLCFSLAVAELIFLFGIFRTEDKSTCGLIAMALHYFFLVSFSWMLMEGVQLYYMLVEVFPAKRSRKPWMYLFSYGFPLCVVAGSAWYDFASYGTEKLCWLRVDNYFIMGFVGPVALILLCNFLFFLMTLRIVCGKSSGYKACNGQNRDTRSWVKGSMVLVVLLGLTWTLGFFWVDQRSIVMAYAFTVVNSLQGLFIFLFHVVFNDKMHEEYRKWVRRNQWVPDCLRDMELSDRQAGVFGGGSTDTSGVNSGSSGGTDMMYPPLSDRSASYQQQQSQMLHHHIDPRLQMVFTRPSANHSVYEYATIAYDDIKSSAVTPRGMYTPRYQQRFPQPVDCPIPPPGFGSRGYNQLQQAAMMTYQGAPPNWYPSSSAATLPISEAYRASPPNFPPPLPPQTTSHGSASDDSAYSDGGSSSLFTAGFRPEDRPTNIVLRMDPTKNPPLFCEGL